MNTRTTLAVVLIAIAIGIFFIVFETDWFGRKLATTEQIERRGEQAQPSIGRSLLEADRLTADRVRRIAVRRPDREDELVIQRDPTDRDNWLQTRPVRFRLRSFEVTDLIRGANELRYTATLKPEPPDRSLAQLGLDPPRATVSFEGPDMQPLTLHLGHRTGAGRGYLLIGQPTAGAEVHIVNDALHTTILEQDVNDLRSRTLASIDAGRARRVTLEHGETAVELAGRDGRWVFTQPVTGRADKDAVETLIRAFNTASIDRFVEDRPATLSPYGLEQPTRILTVTVVRQAEQPTDEGEEEAPAPQDEQPAETEAEPTAGGDDEAAESPSTEQRATHKLVIGGPEDLERTRFFAMYNDVPIVFTLRKSDVDRLDKTIDDLRDPRLTPVARSDVREITLRRADQPTLHFLRDQGAWTFGEPRPEFGLEPTRVNDLLQAVFDAEAEDFLAVGDEPPADPIATLTLAVVAAPEAEVLRLYDREDGRIMVVRGAETTGYLLDREPLQPLLDPPLAYRDLTVLDLTEDAIAELHVIRSGQHPAEYEITRSRPAAPTASAEEAGADDAEDGDTASEPQQPGEWNLEGFDNAAVRRLIDQLTSLRAERWLAEPQLTTLEGVTIRIVRADGAEHTLSIHPDSRVSQVSGVEPQFLAPQPLADAAAAELRDRLVLDLDIGDLAKVERDGLVLRRDTDGRYTLTGGELSESKAGALYDALAGLRAEYYVDASRAAGEPAAALTLTDRDERTHTLEVWLGEADVEPIARLDGEIVFTLPRETAETLTTRPVDEEGSEDE